MGNHDLWTNAEVVRAGLEANGLPVLRNEGGTLDIGGAQLYLAGMDDGWSGQVRIPGLGAPILPDLGQKYDLGLHQVNGMWVYTNRDIGVIAPPVRFNCQPEVTEITLVSG